MITGCRYVIAVPDLARSAAYYRDVLGFDVREQGDPGWRVFVLDGCVIMAGECPNAMPPAELGDHSYFAYLVLDDIDAYHGRVSSAGAAIGKPLRDEAWGMREFSLATVDGHRIMFGQRIG